MNQENVLLFTNEPRTMNEYELTYKGQRIELAGVPGFPSKKLVRKTLDEHTVVAIGEYIHKGDQVFKPGDTLTILPENTYFEVEYKKNGEKAFTLYPRAQVNPNMGLIVSPDIRRQFTKDLYTHISSIPDPETNTEWSEPITNLVAIGERFFVNDFVSVLKKIQKLDVVEGVDLGVEDVAAEAIIEVQVKNKTYELKPVFIIKDKMMGNIPAVEEELGIKISFLNILPQEGKFELATETSQRDYIIMKAIEMPFINVLWLGTIVLMIGFTMAIVRRYKEFKRSVKSLKV
jgi:cytochrome c-type biogenesis protein CcmF